MTNCLIVDDSRVIRKVASRIVEKFGFNISEAEDGEKACLACEKEMPDVILLDWYMPIMNGLEFLKKLRTMAGGDKPIVIFCTTENSMELIQEAVLAGANEYIMKPFDEGILSGKFAQVGLI
ncbi:MAG: response regulator [Pseudomonadota bacterium]